MLLWTLALSIRETITPVIQTPNRAKQTLFVLFASDWLRHPAAIDQRDAVLVLSELPLKMRW